MMYVVPPELFVILATTKKSGEIFSYISKFPGPFDRSERIKIPSSKI